MVPVAEGMVNATTFVESSFRSASQKKLSEDPRFPMQPGRAYLERNPPGLAFSSLPHREEGLVKPRDEKRRCHSYLRATWAYGCAMLLHSLLQAFSPLWELKPELRSGSEPPAQRDER